MYEIGFASFSRQVRADPAWISLGLAASACGTSAEAGAPYRTPRVLSGSSHRDWMHEQGSAVQRADQSLRSAQETESVHGAAADDLGIG